MEPAVGVGCLAALFVVTHLGLASGAVRPHMARRLGEAGFVACYSTVAVLELAVLIAYYAAHRFEGAAGFAAGALPAARVLLVGAIAVGFALMTAGLAVYPRLPVAVFGQPIREPYGIERVTRHPFFAGIAMVGIAHVLLAPRLAGAVLMGALAVLAIVGARHQDARHLARRGAPYARYLAATSAVPFAAIVAGRQRLVWRELPFASLGAGVAAAVVLRIAHESLFAAGGWWIVVAVAAGAALASAQSWLHARRAAGRVRRGVSR